ncbi:MAG: proline dehydrogenase family protein [Chitinophagales bacterium]|nr:proline dehydrogenase family protein [Chitinophagales bacterium]MDW8393697.1 proline dehydrogenase family protein [Chitinophagales bacterium]
MHAVSDPVSFDDTAVAFAHRSDADLNRAYRIYQLINNRPLTWLGTRLTPWAIQAGLPVKGLLRSTLFRLFCGGETLQECEEVIHRLSRFGVYTILDYGVEAKQREDEFDRTTDSILDAIRFAAPLSHVPFVSIKITGICRFALLEKRHAGVALSPEEQQEWQRVNDRLLRICMAAQQHRIGVMVDAEESWIQDPIDELADQMMQRFNRSSAVVLNTFQLYRHDRLAFLRRSFEAAQQGGYVLGAKLVRGAYMEKERRRAARLGYASPIQPDKAACDRDFDEAIRFCLHRLSAVFLCVASHNEKSNLLATQLARQLRYPADHPHLWFSQLFGMSDNITFNLTHAGFRAAKYLPYGPVAEVVPYLMRRAQENTSVAGMSSRELLLLRRERQRRKKSDRHAAVS